MLNFLERALATACLGVPVIRLRPQTKIAMDSDWPSLATTDKAILEKWNQETPDANCAAVAKAQPGGVFFFEIDALSVLDRIKQETGQELPRTYRVRSQPGRGHYYFKQTPASIELGNVAQGFVKNEDFSVRVSDQYVVAANSLHPNTNLPYEVVSATDIAECPDWLIEWFKSQRVEKKKITAVNSTDPIPLHARNDSLISIGGGLRQKGLNYDEILSVLTRINEERCDPPLSEEEVKTIAGSASRYPAGKENLVLVGGRVAGATQSNIIISEPEEELILPLMRYPKFPEWAIRDGSLWEGFIKPICDENSRYPEVLWISAITIMLNFLGNKVRIERKESNLSLYTVLIGRKGKYLKSSSIRDAFRYFEYMGILGYSDQNLANANGKSLVFTPGSAEGLGKELRRTSCKNFIMYWDELTSLVQKCSIDSSTLLAGLLQLYEGANFSNTIKASKDNYTIQGGTYTASVLTCDTDRNFTNHWSRLSGGSTGLDDRFLFILQPETLKPLTPYMQVNTQDGSVITRQRIDAALAQQIYKMPDASLLNKFTAENDNANRTAIRAEKFALALAIDMGETEVGSEQIERALAIAEYERDVKKYLRTYESKSKEAATQLDVLYHLRRNGGRMNMRELYRAVHPERIGHTAWSIAYNGLLKGGWCKESGVGVKGSAKELILLRVPEEDED